MSSGLSQKDVSLVGSSWKAVKDSGATFDAVGMDIFVHLLTNSPHVKGEFTFMDGIDSEAEMRTNQRLQKHATGVVTQVDKAVSMLETNQSDELVKRLSNLGKRHKALGVKGDYFKEVGGAIIATLQKGLGAAFTSDVEQAWGNVYGLIAQVMGKEMTDS